MKCKQCRQPGSPINNLLGRLETVTHVSVLSACAGYIYQGHVNLPERPFILFIVKDLKVLDNLWKKVFSRLPVPTTLTYNGSSQFMFEIDLPKNWPDRNEMLISLWGAIDERMRDYS